MPTKETQPVKKIIVFDLDETLGYFSEFGIFYDSIERFIGGGGLNRAQSFKLIELFEDEILRPKIMSILTSIMKMKKNKIIHSIMIYTNNQGGEGWTYLIKDYFEHKLGMGKIFDNVICAYKVNGRKEKICETCRTSHSKNYKDLVVNCSKLPTNTKVCFIDDQDHKQMKSNKNVYYVEVPQYIHSLKPQTFIDRFLKHRMSSQIRKLKKETDFTNAVLNYFGRVDFYNYEYKTQESKKKDKEISKELLLIIKNFENF